jgi:ribonuclease P protein component
LNPGQTFTKEERISIQREIDSLFEEGSSFRVYPLQIVYVEKKQVSGTRASILVSVSKKRFKRAVKRNRIKRLIRESYRLNKKEFLEFLDTEEKRLSVAFIYISNEVSDFDRMEMAVKKALNSLKEKLSSP